MDIKHAWLHLTRLCGCNYKVAVTPFGKNSVRVPDPQQPGRTYRIRRDLFEQGEFQIRDTWCIEPWSDKAERVTESERNWQT